MRSKAEAALREQRGFELSGAETIRLYTHDSTPSPERQPEIQHGRLIQGGRVWLKRVDAGKHMRRKPFAGWAADVSDVLAARALGVQWVRLDDVNTGRRYWASVDDLCYQGQLFDYGHGEQLCLALERWHVGPNPPEPEPVVMQGVLF